MARIDRSTFFGASLAGGLLALWSGCGAAPAAEVPVATPGSPPPVETKLSASAPPKPKEKHLEAEAPDDDAASAMPRTKQEDSAPAAAIGAPEGAMVQLSEDSKPHASGAPARHKRGQVHAAMTSSMSSRLSQDEIERVVGDNLSRFAQCATGPATIGIKAAVAADGHVVDASCAMSIPDNAQLRDCVAAAFRGLKFAPTSNGQLSPVSFDLQLEPGQ